MQLKIENFVSFIYKACKCFHKAECFGKILPHVKLIYIKLKLEYDSRI